MKIGAVFVLYRPTEAQLAAIAHRGSQGQLAADYVVVDNTPDPSPDVAKAFAGHYLTNENRGGIAGAFNQGVELLLARGCDFVFTFDQDSSIGPDFFDSFAVFVERSGAQLVCPDFVDVNSNTAAHFILLKGLTFRLVQAAVDQSDPLTVSSAISSGLGFSAQLFRRIGGFNEDYVIDHVDTDFCFAAARLGQQVWVNRGVQLRHAIGARTKRRFLLLTVMPSYHAPFRRYYMARNGVDVTRRMMYQQPGALVLEVARISHEVLSVALFEDQKVRKLGAILRGWMDGIRGRLGAAPSDL